MTAKHRRMLVVEDDAMVLSSISRVCSAMGYEVAAAPTVAAGRQALQQAGPLHLVLLDVNLPDGDGISLVRPAMRRLPAPLVLVMTGVAGRKEIFMAAQAGAAGLVEKPVTMEGLANAMRDAASFEPAVAALSASMVGKQGMRAVVEDVRSTMVGTAMAQTGNNKVRAAKLLGVTRQAIQRFEKE